MACFTSCVVWKQLTSILAFMMAQTVSIGFIRGCTVASPWSQAPALPGTPWWLLLRDAQGMQVTLYGFRGPDGACLFVKEETDVFGAAFAFVNGVEDVVAGSCSLKNVPATSRSPEPCSALAGRAWRVLTEDWPHDLSHVEIGLDGINGLQNGRK